MQSLRSTPLKMEPASTAPQDAQGLSWAWALSPDNPRPKHEFSKPVQSRHRRCSANPELTAPWKLQVRSFQGVFGGSPAATFSIFALCPCRGAKGFRSGNLPQEPFAEIRPVWPSSSGVLCPSSRQSDDWGHHEERVIHVQ